MKASLVNELTYYYRLGARRVDQKDLHPICQIGRAGRVASQGRPGFRLQASSFKLQIASRGRLVSRKNRVHGQGRAGQWSGE